MRKKDNSVSLAPFIHTEKNAPYIYLTMIAAMVPCAIYGSFYYGLRAIILILFCMLSFTLSDMLFTHIAGRGGKGEYFDLSSASSGLTLEISRTIKRHTRQCENPYTLFPKPC